MKRNIVLHLVIVCLLSTSIFTFSGCSKKKKNSSAPSSTSKSKPNPSKSVPVLQAIKIVPEGKIEIINGTSKQLQVVGVYTDGTKDLTDKVTWKESSPYFDIKKGMIITKGPSVGKYGELKGIVTVNGKEFTASVKILVKKVKKTTKSKKKSTFSSTFKSTFSSNFFPARARQNRKARIPVKPQVIRQKNRPSRNNPSNQQEQRARKVKTYKLYTRIEDIEDKDKEDVLDQPAEAPVDTMPAPPTFSWESDDDGEKISTPAETFRKFDEEKDAEENQNRFDGAKFKLMLDGTNKELSQKSNLELPIGIQHKVSINFVDKDNKKIDMKNHVYCKSDHKNVIATMIKEYGQKKCKLRVRNGTPKERKDYIGDLANIIIRYFAHRYVYERSFTVKVTSAIPKALKILPGDFVFPCKKYYYQLKASLIFSDYSKKDVTKNVVWKSSVGRLFGWMVYDPDSPDYGKIFNGYFTQYDNLENPAPVIVTATINVKGVRFEDEIKVYRAFKEVEDMNILLKSNDENEKIIQPSRHKHIRNYYRLSKNSSYRIEADIKYINHYGRIQKLPSTVKEIPVNIVWRVGQDGKISSPISKNAVRIDSKSGILTTGENAEGFYNISAWIDDDDNISNGFVKFKVINIHIINN